VLTDAKVRASHRPSTSFGIVGSLRGAISGLLLTLYVSPHTEVLALPVEQIRDKIAGLRGQMRFLKEMAAQVEAAPDHQVSQTDPDARCMNSSGPGTGTVGYNLQAAGCGLGCLHTCSKS
jgi:hypothetical protein